jgi:hypothetical protein
MYTEVRTNKNKPEICPPQNIITINPNPIVSAALSGFKPLGPCGVVAS